MLLFGCFCFHIFRCAFVFIGLEHFMWRIQHGSHKHWVMTHVLMRTHNDRFTFNNSSLFLHFRLFIFRIFFNPCSHEQIIWIQSFFFSSVDGSKVNLLALFMKWCGSKKVKESYYSLNVHLFQTKHTRFRNLFHKINRWSHLKTKWKW